MPKGRPGALILCVGTDRVLLPKKPVGINHLILSRRDLLLATGISLHICCDGLFEMLDHSLDKGIIVDDDVVQLQKQTCIWCIGLRVPDTRAKVDVSLLQWLVFIVSLDQPKPQFLRC